MIQLNSDSTAGLVSRLTSGFTNRQLESNRCWFHTKGDWKQQIPKKVHERDNDAIILEELRTLHLSISTICLPHLGAPVARARTRRRSIHARHLAPKALVFLLLNSRISTTNDGIESKNSKIKEAFRREKLHLRESTQLLAEFYRRQ